MDTNEILVEKKKLIEDLQSIQGSYDAHIMAFEAKTGTMISGVRTTHVYAPGSQWPISIVEDITVVLP